MNLFFKLSKGKGILIFLYWVVSTILCTVIVTFLGNNVWPSLSTFDFYTTEGVAFLVTALWTYLTKDNYYKDKEGNKKKMDTVNSFAGVNMGIWSFIFLSAGLIFLGNLLFHYFP